MVSKTLLAFCFTFFVCACPIDAFASDTLRHPDEKHLRNIRQLTFGGTNAEAYFSFDGTKLIFQSTRPPFACDQIFTMNVDGSEQRMVSTGKGRTTCAYFLPGDKRILYASTHGHSDSCPPTPDKSKGYVWGVFDEYDIYVANADGSHPTLLFESKGMDAEATVSPKGDKIVFTTTKDGDLDLYTMNIDGSDSRKVTSDRGYDGGAFFSWDSKKIVYRANHPDNPASLKEYNDLLEQELVKPSKMEIFVIDHDGSNKLQITSNGAANFAPFFHPDNQRVVYASNVADPKGRQFHLYMVDINTKETKQLTHTGTFNSFAMWSPDKKKIVFVSDRNAKARYEFNVFIADWVE